MNKLLSLTGLLLLPSITYSAAAAINKINLNKQETKINRAKSLIVMPLLDLGIPEPVISLITDYTGNFSVVNLRDNKNIHLDKHAMTFVAPDKMFIGSDDIKYYDINSGLLKKRIVCHGRSVRPIQAAVTRIRKIESLTHNRLAFSDYNCNIYIYDLKNNNYLNLWQADANIENITQLNDSQIITNSRVYSDLNIWDILTNTIVKTLKLPANTYDYVIKISDKQVAFTGYNHVLIILDLTKDKYSKLVGHEGQIVSWIKVDDSKLITGSADKSIRIWNMKTETCQKTIIKAHDHCVSDLVSMDNGLFASGSRDKTLKIWDQESGICLQNIALGYAISKGGLRFISNKENSKILAFKPVDEDSKTLIFSEIKNLTTIVKTGEEMYVVNFNSKTGKSELELKANID